MHVLRIHNPKVVGSNPTPATKPLNIVPCPNSKLALRIAEGYKLTNTQQSSILKIIAGSSW